MQNVPAIIAAASALWVFPAFAGQQSAPGNTESTITLAQLDVCVGPDCRRDRERRNGRYYDRYDEWRVRHRDQGCREVTIRERHGDEVVVKRIHRCD